jgi:hypothetical protein
MVKDRGTIARLNKNTRQVNEVSIGVKGCQPEDFPIERRLLYNCIKSSGRWYNFIALISTCN